MSLVGERIEIMASRDPTKRNLRGEVLLETAKTILLQSGGRRITVEKAGTVLVLDSTGSVLAGDELVGRIEERLGTRKK